MEYYLAVRMRGSVGRTVRRRSRPARCRPRTCAAVGLRQARSGRARRPARSTGRRGSGPSAPRADRHRGVRPAATDHRLQSARVPPSTSGSRGSRTPAHWGAGVRLSVLWVGASGQGSRQVDRDRPTRCGLPAIHELERGRARGPRGAAVSAGPPQSSTNSVSHRTTAAAVGQHRPTRDGGQADRLDDPSPVALERKP
jgi:hypothetical protein